MILKFSFNIDFAFFFLLLRKKEEKRLAKRRKKNRGQAPACREYGNILRKQDIQMIPGDDSKRHTVSSKASLKTRSHNAARGFSYKNTAELLPQHHKASSRAKSGCTSRKCECVTSIFVEMFAPSILMPLKKSLVLFERFFLTMIAPVSFCFLWFISFLFLQKEKEKETNE